MAERNPIRRFFALPNDHLGKTLGFAFMVALVASVFVSVASVLLKPYYQAHLEAERQASMAEMMSLLPGMADLLAEAGVESLVVRLVDLSTGQFAEGVDAAGYDQRAAARDPATSTVLPPVADVAGIKQRANLAPVYMLRRGRALELLVLPVRGVGYQSMLYAYLALKPDGNTIAGLIVYEHGETPGIGARVEDPAWRALWPGKELADDSGEILIEVVRGQAVGPHQVDGISGATRTGNGVSTMLRFWLGDYGFGPFLARLKAGEDLQ